MESRILFFVALFAFVQFGLSFLNTYSGAPWAGFGAGLLMMSYFAWMKGT